MNMSSYLKIGTSLLVMSGNPVRMKYISLASLEPILPPIADKSPKERLEHHRNQPKKSSLIGGRRFQTYIDKKRMIAISFRVSKAAVAKAAFVTKNKASATWCETGLPIKSLTINRDMLDPLVNRT